jgi:hypothetical protein
MERSETSHETGIRDLCTLLLETYGRRIQSLRQCRETRRRLAKHLPNVTDRTRGEIGFWIVFYRRELRIDEARHAEAKRFHRWIADEMQHLLQFGYSHTYADPELQRLAESAKAATVKFMVMLSELDGAATCLDRGMLPDPVARRILRRTGKRRRGRPESRHPLAHTTHLVQLAFAPRHAVATAFLAAAIYDCLVSAYWQDENARSRAADDAFRVLRDEGIAFQRIRRSRPAKALWDVLKHGDDDDFWRLRAQLAFEVKCRPKELFPPFMEIVWGTGFVDRETRRWIENLERP